MSYRDLAFSRADVKGAAEAFSQAFHQVGRSSAYLLGGSRLLFAFRMRAPLPHPHSPFFAADRSSVCDVMCGTQVHRTTAINRQRVIEIL